MKHTVGATALLLILTAFLFAADSYKAEVIRISGLVQAMQYQKAIDAYNKVLQDPSLAPWQKSAAYGDLAYLYVTVKKEDAALDAFEKAVRLGFDDFLAVHQQPAFKPYFGNARFKAAYAKMRISHADMMELFWLSGEVQAAIRDMTSMIHDNLERKDGVLTEVPQQQIPTRKTSSVGVMTNRMVLDIVQGMQRDNVRQSDLSRLDHLTRMGVVDQMPGGAAPSAEARTREVQESSRRAEESARQRRQAIEKRRFVLPAGTSTEPVPVPPLGTVKVQ